MKRMIIITIISCAAWITNIKAQNAADAAMLFSQYYSGGTARSAGMSGAFGALGGDLSVLSANPAGLAVYRGSEFIITPALNFADTKASSIGTPGTFNDKSTRFNINNIGYIYTKSMYNEKGLQSINFGIAYNRLSDFNSKTYITKSTANTSLLDEFVMYANGFNGKDAYGSLLTKDELLSDESAFYEGLAWEMYTINKVIDHEGRERYINVYDEFGENQTWPWRRTMSSSGGIGEYAFSIGLNFNHTLYWGATLGIQDVLYRENYFHKETPNFTESMRYFGFSDECTISGVGLNFKTGIIYRPIPMLRLGANIHTPTHHWLKSHLLTGMEVNWNKIPLTDDGNDPYPYLDTESDPPQKYRITTPWRYGLSAATVIGTRAMVDVDVELVDYSSSNISPKSKYDVENDDISAIYKTAVNVKGGAEVRLGPVYLRGGMAFYGNPYNKSQFDADIRKTLKGTMSVSSGIGFRHRDFYMDAAYMYLKHPERINILYLSDYGDGDEQARLQTTSGKVMLTFGFKF